jgi:hypothetical protein
MLNVEDIHKIQRHRRDARKEIYKKIYEQFCRKIKQCGELGETQAFLRTPSYLVGFPSYDRLKATTYIKRQLDLGRFDVTKISDIDLYVSWKRKGRNSEPREPEKCEIEDETFPTMMNLKKAAAKYRK